MKIRNKTIQKITLASLILLVGLFVIPWDLAEAQVPALLNFTGKVTNLDGSEVADGNYDFTFSIYDQASGGTPLWTESLTAATRFSAVISAVNVTATGTVYSYSSESASSTLRLGQYLSNGTATSLEPVLITDYGTGTNTISVATGTAAWSIGQTINNRPFVEGGVINIHLGSVTDISSIDFSQTRYLEVIFNGETMQPRKVLTTVAASFDTARLDGKTGDEYATLAEDETITGEWNFNNIVSIATSSDTTALTVTQNGAGDIVEFNVGATTSLAVLNDGRVQIGDYRFPTTYGTAGYVLKTDSGGNLYWDVDFGGLGGSGLWATSTDELLMRPVNPAVVVVIGNVATSTFPGYQFEVEGAALFDRVSITNQEELRLYDADSSNYIALRSTSTIPSDFILSLPADAGIPGRALITDGNGNLYWGTPSGTTVYANSGTAGQLAFYETSGVTVSGTSSIYISETGFFAIGTTSPANLLSVGGTSGSQFLVNSSGQVVAGTWQGDIVDEQYGGFGTTTATWTGLAYRDGSDWSATSVLSIFAGGTGATTATAARANLGLAYDQDILTYDADLFTIANLGVIDDGFLVGSSTGSWVVESGNEVRSSLGISNIYTYAIDSTPGVYGSVWISNAVGRGEYIATSSLGLPVGSSAGAGFVAYWQDSGTLTSEQYLSAARGGLGADTSSWYGVPVRSGGAWSATTALSVAFGGTGTSTFQASALLYASADNVISEIPPGSNGYALTMQGGVPTWSSTSPGTTHDLLSAMHTDTTADTVQRGDLITGQGASPSWTRLALGADNFILASDGTDSLWESFDVLFSSSLAGTSTDALSEGSINRYYSTLLFSADLDATTTDALAQGTTNLYWSDSLFDARLAATTSLPNIINLSGLSQVGTIATGTWQSDVITVTYGGTGTSTFQANSLVYASADNTISEILPGANGYALVMQSGVPTWASTSPGTAHGILSVLHSDTENTGTLVRGDLLVASSSNLWDRLALGASGYILYSDGQDAIWSTTTAITALGIIAQGTWQADTIQIAYGGTGATTATGARKNLDLDEIYRFGITSTGTDGYIWMSDGDGRGYWVATGSLGVSGTGGDKVSKFVGTTTVTTDGSISSSSLQGYVAANDICNYEYPGSHFCHVYEIIITIRQDDISYWGNDISDAWVAEGPPGFTSDSNDCTGWTNNAIDRLGAFWMFNDSGGGAGWLVNCAQVKPLACCSRN